MRRAEAEQLGEGTGKNKDTNNTQQRAVGSSSELGSYLTRQC